MVKAKILIVDDDPKMRRGLSETLAEEGYKVSSADSGEEAIEKIKANGFDVVVVDNVMPGMGGMDVLKEIKRIEPQIHIIMITGFATIENAVEAMKCGASDYISKPFKIAEVEVAIKRVLVENKFRKMIKEKFISPPVATLDADIMIKAFSNPIRRGIIEFLDRSGRTRFTGIKNNLDMEDATKLNFHLKVLIKADLIEQDKEKAYIPTIKGIKVAKILRQLERAAHQVK